MQTFTTPAPVAAVLDIPAGRIRVIAADRADTTVEVLPFDAAKSRDVKAAQRITVSYGDGVLRIEAAKPSSALLGSSGYVEVTVQLPTGSSVEAKAASADLRGVGRLGDVTVEAAGGSVELDETASAHLTLQNGGITVGRLGGSAQLSTQKGGLSITEAAAGTVELHTGHGSISVGAAPGTAASLDAGTSFGRVHNALATTGGGTALSIRATTAHGDISARTL
ncbi:DUF4097 family beta strand repeat-containing protein [Winogradskya consettensis]|uniref:DUF4097 domain-containing protein n=1 Tax=Winogradskya consettensis TaxID=113560 RepID=A0A919VPA3_9ACTN|nr:DUF4097 family beta strand repeat-containing protein [Actinoplanes consettensis]GIM70705.1 hypothetical protein Aco04nite_21670 [Actinoplanes consettensis]